MKQQLNKDGIKYLLKPFRWTLLMTISFFLAAGRLDIPRAWLAFGVHLVGVMIGALLMCRFAPGLANQRAELRQGTKKWDKLILILYFLLVLFVIPVSAGLDIGRYRLPKLGAGSAVAGVMLYFCFFTLFHWSMLVNAHFEGSARVQNDRGHRVVMTGPYRFVRHPGYVAMMLACLTDALMIGSRYALIPGLLAVGVTVVRTHHEDRMLRNELAGYAEYAAKTRFRLIPGLW